MLKFFQSRMSIDKPVVNFTILSNVEDYTETSGTFRTDCLSFQIPGRDSGGARTIYIPYCEKQRFSFGAFLDELRGQGAFIPPEKGKPIEIMDFELFRQHFHDIHCPAKCPGYNKRSPNRNDDFPEAVKRILASRVGNHCSNTECRALTSGPQIDPTKALNVGVAAHITAASPGGPRYEPSLTPEQRSSAENGVWLCQTDAKLIDNDPVRYTVDLLRVWKRDAERHALDHIGRTERKPPEKATLLNESLSSQREAIRRKVAIARIHACHPSLTICVTNRSGFAVSVKSASLWHSQNGQRPKRLNHGELTDNRRSVEVRANSENTPIAFTTDEDSMLKLQSFGVIEKRFLLSDSRDDIDIEVHIEYEVLGIEDERGEAVRVRVYGNRQIDSL